MTELPFSGSYDPQDAVFLLKVIELPPMDISERERVIQSGSGHYSEMIGPESPPEESYLRIFRKALERNLDRLASDFLKLSQVIANTREGPITLVSIARSGTPVGVVLGRILRDLFHRDARHYSISVIRDKGADRNALQKILSLHKEDSIVFIDGWTGKGVIARELYDSVSLFNRDEGAKIDPSLAVLTDPAGAAGLAVGTDDYLIAMSLLNSVVSGLISRTILNASHIGPRDFHGCIFYENLKKYDISKDLADRISLAAKKIFKDLDPTKDYRVSQKEREKASKECRRFMESVRERFGITDDNHIKPGLGEATRVLLRRAPELLMIRDAEDPDAEHALYLANERKIPVEVIKDLPYRAAAIIKRLF
jgi:hypothetical protein